MTPSEWSGAPVEPTTDRTPPAVEEWTPVEVPGRPAAFAGADAVCYRTRFADPRSGADSRVVLELRGLFAHARLWCNDEFLGTHDAYFVPARFELPDADDYELLIQCRAPTDRFGGIYDTDVVPAQKAVPGIWWGATVETHPPTFVEDVSISPRSTGDGTVIDAVVTIDAAEAVDDRVTFSVRPEGYRGGGTMERARVRAEGGERLTVERSIDVRDTVWWWPAELGPQNGYTVRASFGDEERVATTGLCDVAYDETDGLTVNGRRLRLRGFNLLPSDDPTADVERAAAANANVVRIHGHVPHPELYVAADEAGILCWQDLPIVGPGGYDVERAKTLTGELVSTFGHHPSLAAFTVHTDPRTPFATGLGSGRLALLRARWRIWRTSFDHGAADRVASTIPDGYGSIPVAGPPGTAPDASHLFPGWDYGEPADVAWLLDRYDGLDSVIGAFGAGALATGAAASAPEAEESAPEAEESVPGAEESVPGFDQTKHARHATDDPDVSQSYQVRLLKTVAETVRRRGSHGAVAFALRDVDRAGMGVLERDGTPKQGYEAIGASFEPIQAVLDSYPTESSGSIPITVINDSTEPIAGTVNWRAGEATGSNEVTVEPLERAPGGTVAFDTAVDRIELTVSTDDRVVSNSYHIP